MKKFLIATAVASVAATSAFATETIRVKVPVVESTANYVTRNVRTPQTSCEMVNVPIYGNSQNGVNTEGAIIGGIVGGIVGNQVGGGSGREAATGVGAMIGAIVGGNSGNKNQDVVGYRQEERCSTTYVNERVQEVAGYTVTYEINGQEYTTHSNRYLRPGTELDINFRVVAVYAN